MKGQRGRTTTGTKGAKEPQTKPRDRTEPLLPWFEFETNPHGSIGLGTLTLGGLFHLVSRIIPVVAIWFHARRASPMHNAPCFTHLVEF
jgi:hypothetical protein